MTRISNEPVYCGVIPPMFFESIPWVYQGTRRVVTKCVEIGSLATITAGWTLVAWTLTGIVLAPASLIFTPVTVGFGAFLTWAGSLVHRNVVQLKPGELYDKLERCFVVAYFINLISVPLLGFSKYEDRAFGFLGAFSMINIVSLGFIWGTVLGMVQADAVKRRREQECFCAGCIIRSKKTTYFS